MKTIFEIVYWVAIIAAAVAILMRRRYPANLDVKRGEADGKNYLDAGVLPASILSYIETQKERGLSGPYEMGLKKALKKVGIK